MFNVYLQCLEKYPALHTRSGSRVHDLIANFKGEIEKKDCGGLAAFYFNLCNFRYFLESYRSMNLGEKH